MATTQIHRTSIFGKWLANLRDSRARVRIAKRIDRLALGNPGQSRSVGDGVVELKIDYGPGYRVYYVTRGSLLIVLLCGGDKSSQDKDIWKAKEMALLLDLEDLT
ncbi:type II toxin-antitoxin system RelE/ParE family toxin [soil metagenome]